MLTKLETCVEAEVIISMLKAYGTPCPYWAAKQFFQLSDGRLHNMVCLCHFGTTVLCRLCCWRSVARGGRSHRSEISAWLQTRRLTFAPIVTLISKSSTARPQQDCIIWNRLEHPR